jgi:diguanylate cyclase (GGDEF)-like protein
MPNAPITLVLTPTLSGDFFGDVLAGVTREVVGANGRVAVVETLKEHSTRDEAGAQGDFAMPIAWTAADSVISVTTAVDGTYLNRLREAGKPVVLLSSTQVEGFAAPEVRPDNHAGMEAVVEHLVAHGHTRIGFVGNMAQRDIAERYEAYCDVLRRHGLEVDLGLKFETPENAESGGRWAAVSVLRSSPRPTALAIATDRNAVGVMRALQSAGLNIPNDIAIAAFDNVAGGTFSTPPLTTVEARFDEVGAIAGRIALQQIRGEDVPHGTVYPSSVMFVTRGSCGCSIKALQQDGLTPSDEDGVADRLRGALLRDMRMGAGGSGSRLAAVEDVVRESAQLLILGNSAPAERIEALTVRLQNLDLGPGALRRFADALTIGVNRRAEREDVANSMASSASGRLAAAVWKAQAGAALFQAERSAAAIAEQYVVDAGLLDTSGRDPRDLHWLATTHVKAAALALWEGEPEHNQLTVVGDFSRGQSLGLVGSTVRTEDFPPRRLIEAADPGNREVTVIVPVSARDKNWGLLAVVAKIDSVTARETYQHWAALLSAALESQRRQEEVRRSALYDGLTGLPNRQLFVRELDQAMARWQRSRAPYAVLFMDLDGFKLINDSLGHHVGDLVLQWVGKAIASQLRAEDTASRFGGDEFVVLLSDTTADDALLAALRIQDALSQVNTFDGHEVVTRASIGIASSEVAYFAAEEVLRDADAAMYRAKGSEPGSIAFFDEPMHINAKERAALAHDVVTGLHRDQFEVHYQPIVNLVTGRTDRFEALLRWRHPERGLLAPEDFLPAIEDTAFIVQLGHWVFDEVCRQIAEWGPEVVNVSVNISDKEFWSQDLLRSVLATLERHGLEPDRLTLEITESVLMRRPEMALRIMQKMHEAGLRLHIDDFGTGFSSLDTLHRFPVDAFKIDRSFIQTLASAENSAELIESLVKLGKALGLSVVAEGVETSDQLDFLRELGCATGQGFLFMPAVEPGKARELLGRSLHVAAE